MKKNISKEDKRFDKIVVVTTVVFIFLSLFATLGIYYIGKYTPSDFADSVSQDDNAFRRIGTYWLNGAMVIFFIIVILFAIFAPLLLIFLLSYKIVNFFMGGEE